MLQPAVKNLHIVAAFAWNMMNKNIRLLNELEKKTSKMSYKNERFCFYCKLTSVTLEIQGKDLKSCGICKIAEVLIFCFEFRELSHLTRDLSEAEKKINIVTS